MQDGGIRAALRHLRTLAAVSPAAALSDGELLGRFAETHDEAAFTALVERHGPMVLGVCRRVLGHAQDAEDACQATFLVLVRKAASVRRRGSTASWLHGVAARIARKLRASRARHEQGYGRREEAAADTTADDLSWREVRAILDEELLRLSEKYRAPLVLCYLEGLTRDEAARRLGLSLTRLRGRLDYGRGLLRSRLSRRGVGLPAALVVGLLEREAPAAVPALRVVSTVQAAALTAAGRALPAGLVPCRVVTLSEGMVRAMFLAKLQGVCAALLLLAGVGASTATQAEPDTAPAATPPAKKAPGQAPKGRPFRIDEINAGMLRDLGNRFDVEVVGRTKGTVSGTELYFYDSDLETAAVHAGLAKPGEKAVITVTVVKCPKNGVGSTQHDVKSLPWQGARAGDTALLLQRRPGRNAEKPRAGDPNAARGQEEERRVTQKPKALTLDEAVQERVNQTATVEFRVASATMAWTTGFGNPDPWVVQLTPTAGLKDGRTFQLWLTSKAVTQLLNLGLLNQHAQKPADFFVGKVIRLTSKVESWEDRGKKGTILYRMCVPDLDHLEVVK